MNSFFSFAVPPVTVKIVDETGIEKSSTIGPYVLGQTLTLKCVAIGGKNKAFFHFDLYFITSYLRACGAQ